ncbi:urease accessory protein UreD [Kineococcus sp. SYSU DK004]|uniref:urease accessory protein UreD n=1 Tax=Kineococcus sp. SYSU DK004 TaxID=3383125 RepID=UPI003D7C555D
MTRVGVHRRGAGTAVDLRAGALAPRVLSTTGAGARVALVGARALLLAGDDVELDVQVGAGCVLDLVEVAGTVAYDGRGGSASWSVRVLLEEGARLLWHGEPFVVAAGADVRRSLDVRMAAGSLALLRETLVLGRTGEVGGRLRSTARVHLAGRPLLVEDLDLRDVGTRGSGAVLGTARCVDTVSVWGARLDGPDALQLDGPGSLVRRLTAHAHDSDVATTWRTWRRAATLPGQPGCSSPV